MRRYTLCHLACYASLLLTSCSSTYERRDPTGETFPSVQGRSLEKQVVAIPEAFRGKPVLLFVGYKMETQFDIDRWLMALQEAKVDVPIYELPTIVGLVPGLFASQIDAGMRSGIPPDDWAIVITLYDDADTVAKFLGNRPKLPARVVLLDKDGRVAFFDDRGYSLQILLRLKEKVDQLTNPEGQAS